MSSIYEETGISINILSSLFSAAAMDFGTFTDEISGYNHKIDADGGYRKATVTLDGSLLDAEEWFENGLGRHVLVFNDAQQVIWEGFINMISLTFGGLQIKRGPVVEITNRIQSMYTRLDVSVDPPVTGTQTSTAWATDAASITKYGQLSEIVSGGTVTDADALQNRDTYLEDHKEPQLSQTLDLAGGGTVQITLECAGYIEYLKRNYYNLASTTMSTVRGKLLATLAAEPNGILSTDYTMVAANTLATPALENKSETLTAIIKALVAKGDAAFNRYTFGLYANRKAVYQPVPTSFTYQAFLPEGIIGLYPGGEVYPWDVLPARWLFYANFLTGRGEITGSLRKDPRAQFIESVTYTAPWGLQTSGGRTDKLTQRIAQLTGTAGT